MNPFRGSAGILTHRSRGNEIIIASRVAGRIDRTMMESVRYGPSWPGPP